MWPFKRKKNRPQPAYPSCTACGSANVRVLPHGGSEVKAWRGKRYLTFQCLQCRNEFYIEEPPGGLPGSFAAEDRIIDNEEELREAEDRLRKEIEDDGDRRFPH